MFTDEERAWFVARERKAYQARLDAAVAPHEPKDQRLAWAYALLGNDEAATPNVAAEGTCDLPHLSTALPIVPGVAGRFARILASPARVTLCVMAVGALLMLGMAILDAMHLPGVRRWPDRRSAALRR